MGHSLWRFLNTDIKDLVSLDTVNEASDVMGTAISLAETLEDPDIQDIAPWVKQGASLLDVLNTPEAELVEALLPFAKIATGLLKFYLTKSQKPLTFSEYAVLVGLKAYSESLRALLAEAEDGNHLPQMRTQGKKPMSSSLLGNIEDFQLSEAEAKETLICFRRSPLAKLLNTLMCDRLQSAGLSMSDVQRLTNRATWNTHRYITEACRELPDEKRRFNVSSLAEWRSEQEKYSSIDTYLKEYTSPDPDDTTRKDRWRVFDESFSLQDLYVPLKAQPLTQNGDVDKEREAMDLETWAQSLLDDPLKQGQVLFIQAGPGRGKSVFCRIFANKVREQLFPVWMPILIRLRDIPTLQNSFENTLREAISADFVKTDDGWLTDKNIRFIFFLDGFDELLMEGRTSGGLEQFLYQVGQFQKGCTSPEMGHRVIVTGRTLALQGAERTLPPNIERVKILPMGDEERTHWFERWGSLVGQSIAEQFLDFLQNDKCPTRIKGSEDETGLVQEPLLLYLLAAMHRDKKLDLDTFAGADGIKAKVLIYEESLDWVLTKQRPDFLNQNLTEFETNALYRILAEAGLCVIQSGGECASIPMIEERLRADDEAKELLETAQARLKENPLRNALAAFYLQPGRKGKGSVEFAHKSFSEFLCAERIKQALVDWTYQGRRNRFEVSDDKLHWEIYDLLGAPVLTEEIVEYLFELLQASNEFKPVALFNRLQHFYFQWCEGEFINRSQDKNFPQQKMLQLQKLDIPTGMKPVDVYTGLNVLIILFKLHAAAQHPNYPNVPDDAPPAAISFHPCEEPGTDNLDEQKLLNIIYYADSLGVGTFTRTCGPHFSRADLESANLRNANLENANLSRVNLYNAYLYSAYLYSANLDSANLSRVNLDDANLSRVNLDSANLDSANLDSANFYCADFYSANLDSANFHSANLSGANLYSANLDSANFHSANLSGANLYSANLDNANLDRASLSGAIILSTNFQSSINLTPEQFTGEDSPLVCSVVLPSYLANAGIDPDRDCDESPQLLSDRYGMSIEEAQKIVDEARQRT